MQISENIQNNYTNNIGVKSNATPVALSQVRTSFPEQKNIQKNNAMEAKKVEEMVKEINELSLRKEVGVNFHKDSQIGQNVVQFIDNSTREVIKQFPSEEMLKVIQQIDKFLESHGKSASVGDLLNEVA